MIISRKSQPRMDAIPRPSVAARVRLTKPYDPVSSLQAIKHDRRLDHYKLDWNESTIAPSPKVFEALRRFLDGDSRIQWYPDLCHDELYRNVSEYAGCRTEQIMFANGSDDALAMTCQTYLNPGDGVVAPFPTYTHFLQFAELAGAGLRLVRKDDPFSVSLRDIGAAIDGRTKMVYLANPNNPTGTLFPPAEIAGLAGRHPHVLFLVDEAYYEFSGCSCAAMIRSLPNIMVTRSFSKCFGLAGLRIGYVAAPEEIIANLRRVHNPKSINKMAQVAAAAALDDLDYYRDYVAGVKRSAAMTRRFCDDHGIVCRLSHANFVLIELENPSGVAARLREVGVHVRDRSSQLPGMIRLTLGTPEQMRDVLSRLENVLDGCRPVRLASCAQCLAPAHAQMAEDRPCPDPAGAMMKAALRL